VYIIATHLPPHPLTQSQPLAPSALPTRLPPPYLPCPNPPHRDHTITTSSSSGGNREHRAHHTRPPACTATVARHISSHWSDRGGRCVCTSGECAAKQDPDCTMYYYYESGGVTLVNGIGTGTGQGYCPGKTCTVQLRVCIRSQYVSMYVRTYKVWLGMYTQATCLATRDAT
jgi:hypothetical protein